MKYQAQATTLQRKGKVKRPCRKLTTNLKKPMRRKTCFLALSPMI
jgi:hypothetical protein